MLQMRLSRLCAPFLWWSNPLLYTIFHTWLKTIKKHIIYPHDHIEFVNTLKTYKTYCVSKTPCQFQRVKLYLCLYHCPVSMLLLVACHVCFLIKNCPSTLAVPGPADHLNAPPTWLPRRPWRNSRRAGWTTARASTPLRDCSVSRWLLIVII